MPPLLPPETATESGVVWSCHKLLLPESLPRLPLHGSVTSCLRVAVVTAKVSEAVIQAAGKFGLRERVPVTRLGYGICVLSVAEGIRSVPHAKGEATLPSTRADCPLGGQHKKTKERRQLCPAHYKGRAQNGALGPRGREPCSALVEGRIGLSKERNSRENVTHACYKVRTRNHEEAKD
ncbi:uncharacterized protein DS421_4g126870 [Arachis hypogaea]|nr:uncharacterized protein DS421_4g126870 [Arachis hypogaea]